MQVAGQLNQQIVQGSLADNAQLTLVQALKNRARGVGQTRIAGQDAGKTQLAIGWCFLKQAAELTLQPMRVEVKHPIGEATGSGGFSIVDVTRLQMKDLARSALMPHPAAVELLYALLSDPHQIAVMPMRIISVAGKMGAQGFNTGIGIVAYIDPVLRSHDHLRWTKRDANSKHPGMAQIEDLCNDKQLPVDAWLPSAARYRYGASADHQPSSPPLTPLLECRSPAVSGARRVQAKHRIAVDIRG